MAPPIIPPLHPHLAKGQSLTQRAELGWMGTPPPRPDSGVYWGQGKGVARLRPWQLWGRSGMKGTLG